MFTAKRKASKHLLLVRGSKSSQDAALYLKISKKKKKEFHRNSAEVIFNLFLLPQENSYLFRTSLYLAASASAEFFADIALAPMEAVKVRIQTQPGWANTLREGVPKLMAEEGIRG